MSSPKSSKHHHSKDSKSEKKVRYENGTKPGHGHSHGHQRTSSRDSGIGTSTASDRASLGTTNEAPFLSSEIADQRYNLRAVQNALDAALDKIKALESANAQLNSLLTESNKENRLLKKEKSSLLHQVDCLLDDLEYERKVNERLLRASASPPPKIERRPASSSRRESGGISPSSQPRYVDDRSSYSRGLPVGPLPSTYTTDSFTPRTTYSTSPPALYTSAPSTFSYTPTAAYTTAPPHLQSPRYAPNDGKYHLQPL